MTIRSQPFQKNLRVKYVGSFFIMIALLFAPNSNLLGNPEICMDMPIGELMISSQQAAEKHDCDSMLTDVNMELCDSCFFNLSALSETVFFSPLPLIREDYATLSTRFIPQLNSPPLLPPPLSI